MTLSRIAVVGAGVMGSGIAQSLALAGCDVTLRDLDDERLAAAMERIEHGRFGLRRATELGKLSAGDADGVLARIRPTTDLATAVDGADLVLEAVFEHFGVKVRVMQELDRLARPGTIIATNTSGFQIAALAGATDRPELVLGWHWASPASVMKLAEIVVHDGTSAVAVDAVTELARRAGKNPVVVKDDPTHWGFVANRVFFAALEEAEQIVAAGIATQEQVDQLMKDCFRWPVGPFELVRSTRTNWDANDPNQHRDVPQGHATLSRSGL